MSIELMSLPFEQDSLEPHMSEETISYHYGEHHKGYVETLNDLIADTNLNDASLEDIIEQSKDDPDSEDLFNNAAQVWNHNFFWKSLSPDGGNLSDDTLKEKIDSCFGGLDGFKSTFKDVATGEFASGWAWLVLKDGELSIISTSDAVPPFIDGFQPLLTCDVWEHAYYLDHRNDRGKFIETFLDELVNWDFAADRYQELTEKS